LQTTVLVRADASSSIGIGHVIRTLSLARELRSLGIGSVYVIRKNEGNLSEYIKSLGFNVYEMEADTWQNDADCTIQCIGKESSISWVIVDHYDLDKRWESKLKNISLNIMVLDDLANREHNCDLLLDQNYHIDASERYQGLVPESCKLVLGPSYALVRKEFTKLAENTESSQEEVKKILITMGGADALNVTKLAIEAISGIGKDYEINVVIGSANRHKNMIKAICDNFSNINYHYQTERMAELISQADICVGAGGSTSWERGMLGLATLTIVTAENQLKTTADLDKVGATILLGIAENIDVGTIRVALQDLINNNDKRRRISKKIREICQPSLVNTTSLVANYISADLASNLAHDSD